MTLSINRRGYPALLYFALIALVSMSRFDAIFLDLCKFPEMVSCLYLFGILETQGTAFLFYFWYTCVVTTPSLFKVIFVSKNFWGFTYCVLHCQIKTISSLNRQEDSNLLIMLRNVVKWLQLLVRWTETYSKLTIKILNVF